LTFHVPQEAGPAILIPLLEAIHNEQASFHAVAALLDFAQEHGFISRPETTIFALDSGLLQKADTGAIELSDDARILLALKPEVRPDIIH
jgi:hypothetical protein